MTEESVDADDHSLGDLAGSLESTLTADIGETLVGRARRRGTSTIVGVLPGVVAAGCASCGAGVLGALGFVGTMAALPYDGNLLRVGGIVLLLFFLGRAGDPRTCSIDPT